MSTFVTASDDLHGKVKPSASGRDGRWRKKVCVTLLSTIMLSGTMAAQTFSDAYWNRIVDRADSVMMARFGREFFLQHIFVPEDEMDYVAFDDTHLMWSERDSVASVPLYAHFEYDIGLDTMHVGRRNISFNITPEGVLLEDGDMRGFNDGPAPLAFHTDLAGFVKLAKSNGVKCHYHEAFRDLRWIPNDTVLGEASAGKGHYELILGRVRKKEKERRLSTTTFTYHEVDAIVFDPFTGAVLRTERREETTRISCGRLL